MLIRSKISLLLLSALACSFALTSTAVSQTFPKVTVIDMAALKTTLKPKGKPLVVNFWATWCLPCRAEFPELVKLANDNKAVADFITISVDDAVDLKTGVPRFLKRMKADKLPAYFLDTATAEDEDILKVVPVWGSLPITLVIAPSGDIVYSKAGKFKAADVTSAVHKAAEYVPSP